MLKELNRISYGFEISKEFYRKAKEQMLAEIETEYKQLSKISCGI